MSEPADIHMVCPQCAGTRCRYIQELFGAGWRWYCDDCKNLWSAPQPVWVNSPDHADPSARLTKRDSMHMIDFAEYDRVADKVAALTHRLQKANEANDQLTHARDRLHQENEALRKQLARVGSLEAGVDGQDLPQKPLPDVVTAAERPDRGIAWILSERAPSGRERTDHIALTPEDATDFVRHNDEPGYTRTSLPLKIYRATPASRPEPSPSLPSGRNDRAMALLRDIAEVRGSHQDHQRRAERILRDAQ